MRSPVVFHTMVVVGHPGPNNERMNEMATQQRLMNRLRDALEISHGPEVTA